MKLFIAKLPFDIVDKDLFKLFEAYGKVVSARVILHKVTNHSRGFGLIEMENQKGGLLAIEKLDNTQLKGQKIMVNKAIKAGQVYLIN